MPIKLKNLIVDRVDLVGQGDNPQAHIALFKRKQEEEENETPSWVSSILDGIAKLVGKEGEKEQMGVKDKDPIVIEEEKVNKVEGETEVDRLKTRIAELEAQLAETKKAEEEMPKDEEEEEMPKKEKPMDDEEEDEVIKGLPESVQNMLRKAQERAEKAENIAKEIQDKQEIAKYVDVAKQFPSLITTPETFGPILKNIAKNNKEDFATVEAVLKAANALLEENNILMKELGSGEGTEGTDKNAWNTVEGKAKALMEKDGTLSKERAIKKVLEMNPSMYAEYQKELIEGEV